MYLNFLLFFSFIYLILNRAGFDSPPVIARPTNYLFMSVKQYLKQVKISNEIANNRSTKIIAKELEDKLIKRCIKCNTVFKAKNTYYHTCTSCYFK